MTTKNYYIREHERPTAKSFYLQYACTSIATIVYAAFYFGWAGETKEDCYYVRGSTTPMTVSEAKIVSKASKHKGDPLYDPLNVTEKFDWIILLGFWMCIIVQVFPFAFCLLKSAPGIRNCILGLAGCAFMILEFF